ncbi:transposase [Neobacillus notoginsengisoli]|uniref:transposase n=1 Tax=Neobacillus notoginsengisoli TaxID=1578198 RepID=UPI001F00D121|nr:transposase [Neobacillus notoginsengisoli]
MPRKNREWFPGAMYHITCRGIRRALLFHDDHDRVMYLLFLETAKNRFGFQLHAFCIMPNHVHLQLETADQPPWKIMQYINSAYAVYFNKKHHHTGHVFDKRFNAVLVGNKKYELELSRYIHLNPLRAGLVSKLEDYDWSSYPAYASTEPSPLVTTSRLLSYFKKPNAKNYLDFIERTANKFPETKTVQRTSPVRSH